MTLTLWIKVLFPLLAKLLENIDPQNLIRMEETRMRASTLLCKVFLQRLTTFVCLSTFTALWLTILDYMDKYIKSDKSDLLVSLTAHWLLHWVQYIFCLNFQIAWCHTGIIEKHATRNGDHRPVQSNQSGHQMLSVVHNNKRSNRIVFAWSLGRLVQDQSETEVEPCRHCWDSKTSFAWDQGQHRTCQSCEQSNFERW